MTQASFWHEQAHSTDFAELCNGLYEREISLLANASLTSAKAVQARLQSLPHYVNRTAHLMMQVITSAQSPLQLDVQNASWSVKQASKIPLTGQDDDSIINWYKTSNVTLGLVVPVQVDSHIILDCIDRLDSDRLRIRTNVAGWFSLIKTDSKANNLTNKQFNLLRPNKKVMLAACAGHCWQQSNKLRPIIPSLRELLLSCSINWQNFKKPLTRGC